MSAKSYSQWSTFQKCGAQYKYRYLDRLPTPAPAAAAARGTNIHKNVEDLLNGEIDTFPNDTPLEPYEDFFKMLRDKGAKAELEFFFNEDWESVEKHEDPWVRGVIDVVVPLDELYVYELKTGKEWDDHVSQRHFYGVAALDLFPEYQVVKVTGVYLDGQFNRENTYKRSMLGTYHYMWKERFQQMDMPEAHVPRPGPYCRWCPFSKDKGGPCQFSGN